MAFADYENASEIKDYLKRVLNRTGGKEKRELYLYHYTNLDAGFSILNGNSFWLASSDKMNDFLEGDFLKSSPMGSRFFFTSFSKNEESLAMYKMYAPNPKGIVISFSYDMAEKIISDITNLETKKSTLYIVRNNVLTNETIDAEVYWSAVCYKELRKDEIFAETVSNSKIKRVFNQSELAGFVKPYGWRYEKEIRLCAITERALNNNEKVAIKFSDEVANGIKITLCPGFDKQLPYYKKIARICNSINGSPHDGFVDLGEKLNYLEQDYIKLQEECIYLRKSNDELLAMLRETSSLSEEFIGVDIKISLYREVIDWVTELLKKGNELSLQLENSLNKVNLEKREEYYKIYKKSFSEMSSELNDNKGKFNGILNLLSSTCDCGDIVKYTRLFLQKMEYLENKYYRKKVVSESLDENNEIFGEFHKNMETVQKILFQEIPLMKNDNNRT